MHSAHNNKRKVIQGMKNRTPFGTSRDIRGKRVCVTLSGGLNKRLAAIGPAHEATIPALSDGMRIRLRACTSAAALVKLMELFL